MCRSLSRFALASFAAVSLVSSVHAGPPPSGTITCAGVAGRIVFGAHGLPTAVALHPETTKLQLSKATSGVCDASGVVGGSFGIDRAEVTLRGRLVEGESCADFYDTLAVEKTKLAVRWRGSNAYGRHTTIATSKAEVASAVYDSDTNQLVLTTAPVARGGFAGSTLTLRFGADFLSGFDETTCSTFDAVFSSRTFGADGTTTISVP